MAQFERIREGILDTSYYNAIRLPGVRVLDEEGRDLDDHPKYREDIIFDGNATDLYYPEDAFLVEGRSLKIRRIDDIRGEEISTVGELDPVQLPANDMQFFVPGDFETIQDALAGLVGFAREDPSRSIVIKVGEDYVQRKTIRLHGGDYSNITITADHEYVFFDMDEGELDIFSLLRCNGPTLRTGFTQVDFDPINDPVREDAPDFAFLDESIISIRSQIDREEERCLFAGFKVFARMANSKLTADGVVVATIDDATFGAANSEIYLVRSFFIRQGLQGPAFLMTLDQNTKLTMLEIGVDGGGQVTRDNTTLFDLSGNATISCQETTMQDFRRIIESSQCNAEFTHCLIRQINDDQKIVLNAGSIIRMDDVFSQDTGESLGSADTNLTDINTWELPRGLLIVVQNRENLPVFQDPDFDFTPRTPPQTP